MVCMQYWDDKQNIYMHLYYYYILGWINRIGSALCNNL